MTTKHLFTHLIAAGGLLAIAGTANAQAPCGEAMCPAGYSCKVGSYDACDDECANAPGGDGDCQASSCETVEYEYCERAACETDADCGGTMVCHTSVHAACPPAACVDETCEPSPGCVETEITQCTPRSELPCQTADDCGAGYDCVEAVTCTCSGTSPGATPDPGAPVDAPIAAPPSTAPTPSAAPIPSDTAPAPPEDCSCTPSGINYCQLEELECETDADCPADFNCIASPSSCWQDSDGNGGCIERTAMCYPPSEPGGGRGEPPPVPPGDAPDVEAPISDDSDGNVQTGESLGGLFALFGCSIKPGASVAAGSSWAIMAGLASLFVRRRRAVKGA